MWRFFAFFSLLALAACTSGSAFDPRADQLDSGSGAPDAGTDAGVPDAGRDAGAPFDAGYCTSNCIGVLDVIQCPQLTTTEGCTILFPRLQVGGESTETVTLINTGTLAIQIESVAVVGGPFTVDASPPAVLGPQQSAVLPVTFRATDAGTFRSHLEIHSTSDYRPMRQVPIYAGTESASCQGSADCLADEGCAGAVCTGCVMPTPPRCEGGLLISVDDGSGCKRPVCRCADDEVWSAGFCIAAVACTGGASCDAGTCAADACCSFPTCLCGAVEACR